MGMEIIRLGGDVSRSLSPELNDFGKLSFATHHVPSVPMSIWLMSSSVGKQMIPWWDYNAQIDEDLKRLSDLWSVTSAQSFFDCLFLSQFKRIAGQNLYMIVPGYLRTDGWDKLPETSKAAYLRGQGCVYRLEGAYSSRLAINWVPFAQPQCIIKDPSFSSFWPMFVASRNDDVANSIGFFSLSDPRKLPLAVSLLIQPNDQRSNELSKVVDWFGMYSSPISPEYCSSAVVYSKDEAIIERMKEFQQKFELQLLETRNELREHPLPHTAFRILSRFVAI
jgi:hypothetical protein